MLYATFKTQEDRPIGPYVISVQLEELYQHLQIEKMQKSVA